MSSCSRSLIWTCVELTSSSSSLSLELFNSVLHHSAPEVHHHSKLKLTEVVRVDFGDAECDKVVVVARKELHLAEEPLEPRHEGRTTIHEYLQCDSWTRKNLQNKVSS